MVTLCWVKMGVSHTLFEFVLRNDKERGENKSHAISRWDFKKEYCR